MGAGLGARARGGALDSWGIWEEGGGGGGGVVKCCVHGKMGILQ